MVVNGEAEYQRSEGGHTKQSDQIGSASAQHRVLIQLNSLNPKWLSLIILGRDCWVGYEMIDMHPKNPYLYLVL